MNDNVPDMDQPCEDEKLTTNDKNSSASESHQEPPVRPARKSTGSLKIVANGELVGIVNQPDSAVNQEEFSGTPSDLDPSPTSAVTKCDQDSEVDLGKADKIKR